MDFHFPEDSCTETRYVDGETVEYEIVFGNEKLVFIKAGAGGSARGNEDKCLKMARQVHERIGATVICASNPDTPHENIDEAEIRKVISEKTLSNVEISFLGTSDGAYQNLSLAKRFSETAKWIGINASFIDVSDLKEKLMALSGVIKVLIYGTMDDDFDEVVPALKNLACNNLQLEFVEGADHSFSGMIEEFIALSDYVC